MGNWEFQFYVYGNFWNLVFSFCIKNVMFLDFFQPFAIFFCLASGFWFQPRSWQVFGFGIALSCSSGRSFWGVTFLIDATCKKPKSKIHFPRRGDKYPLRGIPLKGVRRETKTTHFHQILRITKNGSRIPRH